MTTHPYTPPKRGMIYTDKLIISVQRKIGGK